MLNYHIEILQQEFSKRKDLNPYYSLRAYGKALGIHYSTLSKILKGERSIPITQLEALIKRLNLSPEVAKRFETSALNTKGLHQRTEIKKSYILLTDALHYKVIAEWEYYAVYFLFDLADFEFNPQWMALRLGVPIQRIKEVLFDLTSLGLLVQNAQGEWTRKEPQLTTTDDVSSEALRQSHKQDIRRAEDSIDQIPVGLRSIHSMLIPTNPKQLEKAKRLIRHFLDEMSLLMEDGEKSELYQVNVQLFPITNPEHSIKGHA
jgi:uncharacterized protein (TIGR02147 family)